MAALLPSPCSQAMEQPGSPAPSPVDWRGPNPMRDYISHFHSFHRVVCLPSSEAEPGPLSGCLTPWPMTLAQLLSGENEAEIWFRREGVSKGSILGRWVLQIKSLDPVKPKIKSWSSKLLTAEFCCWNLNEAPSAPLIPPGLGCWPSRKWEGKGK